MNYLATTNSVMGAEDEAFCLDLENLLRHSGQMGQSDESRAVLRACRRREDSMYRLRTSVRDTSNGESGKEYGARFGFMMRLKICIRVG